MSYIIILIYNFNKFRIKFNKTYHYVGNNVFHIISFFLISLADSELGCVNEFDLLGEINEIVVSDSQIIE